MTGEHVIWLVVGEYTDYEDYRKWVVCWRHTEAEAEALCLQIRHEHVVACEKYDEWMVRNPSPYGTNFDRYTDAQRDDWNVVFGALKDELYRSMAAPSKMFTPVDRHHVHWDVESCSDVPR